MQGNFSPAPFQPQTPLSGGGESIKQQSNGPSGFESTGTWSQSVSRSQTIKKATTAVINTRDELATFLMQYQIKLLTSSIEFQQTGDFLLSSYVMFTDHGNITEPLTTFLERYPTLVEPVEKIRQTLHPVQSMMQIKTNKNPF